MNISIASDHAGFDQKQVLAAYLKELGYNVIDRGPDCDDRVDYPDFAEIVAHDVVNGEAERGVLVCGTGIGMCICANKVPGIRAAVCHDPYSAERSRKSNNAQIMCMGERVIGAELAKTLVDTWLPCEFAGGGSAPKVAEISRLEQEHIRNAAAQ